MEVGARRNSAAATEAAANDPAAADASEEGSLQTYDCVLSPTDYWTLRDDPRWFQYVINSDPAPKTLIEVSRTEEDGVVKRVSKVTPERNPIPVLMRGTLGCKDGFTITMNETWKRGSFGKEHPMTFWHEPPVFKDRIRITGMQWVEPHPENATGCRIFFRLNVTVIGSGAAKTVAKGIEKGYLAGYAQLPAGASPAVRVPNQGCRPAPPASSSPHESVRAAPKGRVPTPAGVPLVLGVLTPGHFRPPRANPEGNSRGEPLRPPACSGR